MKRIELTLPFSVELTQEDSWSVLNEKKTSFGIVRCHFQLNERLIEEPHKVGEALAVYKSPKGVGSQHVISSSFELEEIKQVSSIEKFLVENESVALFASEFAAKAGVNKHSNVSAKVKSELSQKLKTSVSSANELHESQKIRKTTTFEIKNDIGADIILPIVAVPAYKRKAYDLILSYVDFLRVDYERSLFGLRRKAKKSPPIIDFNEHPNKIKFGLPLCTIMYWEFSPRSSVLMIEDEHKVEVKDAEQIAICPPMCKKIKYVKFPDVPSLYQIANAAFPLKWILRKCPDKSWTEETLKLIELDEIKKKPNGWWERYGKKANKKKQSGA
jgi:hypothetical protein